MLRLLVILLSAQSRLTTHEHAIDDQLVARGIPGRFSVSPSSLYLAAALVAPSIVPYTRMIMWNTVTALEAKATGATMEPTDADTKSLIEKWSRQSFNRALMIATSALLGGAAILAGVQ